MGDHEPMRLTRALLALIVTAVIVGLTPAAYADPPDPTWISGLWDDDDFDDTVIIIAHTCAIDALAPVDMRPLPAPVASVEQADPVDPAIPLRSPLHSRAPPVASLPHC